MDDDSDEYAPYPQKRAPAHSASQQHVKKGGHSDFVGVTWHRQDQKWQAAIKVEGKSLHLGHFLDEYEAARKYDEHAARLGRPVNFPEEVYGASGRPASGGAAAAARKGHHSKGKGPPPRSGRVPSSSPPLESSSTLSQQQQHHRGRLSAPPPPRSEPVMTRRGAGQGTSRSAVGEGADEGEEGDPSTDFVGVTWNRRAAKWEVRIYAAGRNTYLGSYDSDVVAAQKYDEHASRYGKALNFPGPGEDRATKGTPRGGSSSSLGASSERRRGSSYHHSSNNNGNAMVGEGSRGRSTSVGQGQSRAERAASRGAVRGGGRMLSEEDSQELARWADELDRAPPGTRPSRGYVAQGRSASMSDEPSSMIGRSSDRANPGSGSQKRKGRSNSSSSRPPAAPASSHHSRAAPQAANKHRRHPRTPPTTSTSSNGAGGGAVRGSRVSSSSSSAGTAAGEQKRRRLAASAAAHAWQDAAESGGSSSSTRTSRSSRSGEEEDDDAISGEEENNVTSGRGGGSRLHSSEWGDNASGGYGGYGSEDGVSSVDDGPRKNIYSNPIALRRSASEEQEEVEDDRAAAASILALSGHWSAPAPAPGAPAAASESMSETLKRQLSRLVHQLMKHDKSYLFRKPVQEYAELDEAFRRQYARSVAKPMDLRTVRDRLLGRVKAGDAAKASQNFFLKGQLDSLHNPGGVFTGGGATDPPGALKVMPLRGLPRLQPPSSSSLSTAAAASAPAPAPAAGASGAAPLHTGPAPQALLPTMMAVEQSCPTPTAAGAAEAATAAADVAASLGTAAELATGPPPTEDLEASSLTEEGSAAVPIEGAMNAQLAAAGVPTTTITTTTTDASAASTADEVAPSSSAMTSALAALAALAAGPEATATATKTAASAPASSFASSSGTSASELAAASKAASISTATAAAAAALAGEPFVRGGGGEMPSIGYRSLDEFAADLAQIWWNAEQYNERDSEPAQQARQLKRESSHAIRQLRANENYFDDLPGFTDWRVDHALVGRHFVDAEGDEFCVTGWLKPSARLGQEELWHARYTATGAFEEFDINRAEMDAYTGRHDKLSRQHARPSPTAAASGTGARRHKKGQPPPPPLKMPPTSGRAGSAATTSARRKATGKGTGAGRGQQGGGGATGGAAAARVPPTAGHPRDQKQGPASLRTLTAAAARAAVPPAALAEPGSSGSRSSSSGESSSGGAAGATPFSSASAWAAFHPSFMAQQAQLQQLQAHHQQLINALQIQNQLRLGSAGSSNQGSQGNQANSNQAAPAGLMPFPFAAGFPSGDFLSALIAQQQAQQQQVQKQQAQQTSQQQQQASSPSSQKQSAGVQKQELQQIQPSSLTAPRPGQPPQQQPSAPDFGSLQPLLPAGGGGTNKPPSSSSSSSPSSASAAATAAAFAAAHAAGQVAGQAVWPPGLPHPQGMNQGPGGMPQGMPLGMPQGLSGPNGMPPNNQLKTATPGGASGSGATGAGTGAATSAPPNFGWPFPGAPGGINPALLPNWFFGSGGPGGGGNLSSNSGPSGNTLIRSTSGGSTSPRSIRPASAAPPFMPMPSSPTGSANTGSTGAGTPTAASSSSSSAQPSPTFARSGSPPRASTTAAGSSSGGIDGGIAPSPNVHAQLPAWLAPLAANTAMGGTSSGASAGGAGGGAANGPSATLEAQLIAAATHLEPSQRALLMAAAAALGMAPPTTTPNAPPPSGAQSAQVVAPAQPTVTAQSTSANIQEAATSNTAGRTTTSSSEKAVNGETAASETTVENAGRTCQACAKAKVKCYRTGPNCGRCTRLGVLCVDQPRGRGRPPSGKTDTMQLSPGKTTAAQTHVVHQMSPPAAGLGSQDASQELSNSVSLPRVGGGVGSTEAAAPGTPPVTAPVDEPLTGSNQPWNLAGPTTSSTNTTSTGDATSPSSSLSLNAPSGSTAVHAGTSAGSAPQPLSVLRFDDDDNANYKASFPTGSINLESQVPSSASGTSLFGPPIARALSASSKDSNNADQSLVGHEDETSNHSGAPPEVSHPASKKLKLPDGSGSEVPDEGKDADLDGLGLAQPFDVDTLVDNTKNSSSSSGSSSANSTSGTARPNKRPLIS